MKITKENTVGIRQVDFPNGSTKVVVAVVFTAACGCVVEFGVRVDNKETCMAAYVCDAHHPKWGTMRDILLADENRDLPTTEVLQMGFQAMETT